MFFSDLTMDPETKSKSESDLESETESESESLPEFVTICEQFMREFNSCFPNNLTRYWGRYEQCIKYAFDRIEALDHVERITLLDRYSFLVSTENQMAVFLRCVRQEGNKVLTIRLHWFQIFTFFSPARSRNSGRATCSRKHDYAYLDRNNVASIGVAKIAMRTFFNEYNVGDGDYTLVLSFGILIHCFYSLLFLVWWWYFSLLLFQVH